MKKFELRWKGIKAWSICFCCFFFLSAGSVWGDEALFLATNSWTAAYAEAAGIEAVEALAPADMVHPPEYELRPSDITRLNEADYLVYAGYEVLMKTVFESFQRPDEAMIAIGTGYSPDIIRGSVLKLAAAAGTEPAARRELAEIDAFFTQVRKEIAAKGWKGLPVLVHFHQRPFIESLGFDVRAVFGPGPLKATQIGAMAETAPRLIIDNVHNSQDALGPPLAEITGAPTAELVNFPGFPLSEGGSVPLSLLGVLRHNWAQLEEALRTATF